jgi:hypothetical protein
VAVSELGPLFLFDFVMFKSKLKGDSFFRQLKIDWENSEVCKDLAKKMKMKKKKKVASKSPAYSSHSVVGGQSVGTLNSVVACEHCDKNIDRMCEIYYTIGKDGPWKEGSIKRSFYYHAECFQEIAGDEFM